MLRESRTTGSHRKQAPHFDEELDHRPIASRKAFLGRKQGIIHITNDKIIAEC